MGGIGPMSLIIIGVVALLIFGPKKLPELGKAFGSTLREFKNATKGFLLTKTMMIRKRKN